MISLIEWALDIATRLLCCMYKGKDMRCEGCKQDIDTQSHVLVCNTYSDLRVNMDLSDEDDMIGYFRKVLKRRMKE